MLKAEEAREFEEMEIKVKKKASKAELEGAKQRITAHFSELERSVKRKRWANRFQGTAYVALGGLLLTAYVKMYSVGGDLFSAMLLPAGWLSLFLGAEFVMADWRLKPEHNALKKMKDAYCELSN
ncbi:MAG: hypothetical protein ABIF01_02930 [Candidatus Micrarchaeota archaeon]